MTTTSPVVVVFLSFGINQTNILNSRYFVVMIEASNEMNGGFR